jgi:hypothetical protein
LPLAVGPAMTTTGAAPSGLSGKRSRA